MKKRATLKKTPKVSAKKRVKKATKKSIKPSKRIKRTKATKKTRKPATKGAKTKAKAVSTDTEVVKAKNVGGRPSLYTEEKVQAALVSLRKGISQSTTAAIIGITRQTWARWKDEHDGFRDRVAQAVAEGQKDLVTKMQELVNHTNPAVALQATTFLLKNRHAEDFGGGGKGDGGTVVIQQQNVILAAGEMLEDALKVLDANGANHYKVGHAEGEAHVAAKRVAAEVTDAE